MRTKRLDSMATSVFCDNLAMMFSAGIPSEEAISLLHEDADEGALRDAISAVEEAIEGGATLAKAIQGSGCFPQYASTAIVLGEKAGRTESTLRSLASYYSELDIIEQRLKSALVYPTAMLLIMAVILAVMLFAVLPTFTSVYEGLSGNIATSSYGYVRTANVIVWIALIITIVLAVVFAVVTFMVNGGTRSSSHIMHLFQKMPVTRKEFNALACAHFAGMLGTLLSSGLNVDEAFEQAAGTVDNPDFSDTCRKTEELMAGGEPVTRAIYRTRLFEPLYARMLISGEKTGQLEDVLGNLSKLYYEEAREGINGVIGTIEPTLAGFLTVAVGLSLVAIMLPLIGIMGGIG